MSPFPEDGLPGAFRKEAAGGAGVGSGFAGGHVAADEGGHIAAADLFVRNELHASSLAHSISGFDETNQTTGFDHAKSVHCELLLGLLLAWLPGTERSGNALPCCVPFRFIAVLRGSCPGRRH